MGYIGELSVAEPGFICFRPPSPSASVDHSFDIRVLATPPSLLTYKLISADLLLMWTFPWAARRARSACCQKLWVRHTTKLLPAPLPPRSHIIRLDAAFATAC